MAKAKVKRYKGNNPKTAIGATKIPIYLVPSAGIHHEAMAFEDGANKYGPYNWRDKKVSAVCYVDAAFRHLYAYLDGEETAQDSGVSHLGHARACLGILLDALETGMLIDDRPKKGAAARIQREYHAKKSAKCK